MSAIESLLNDRQAKRYLADTGNPRDLYERTIARDARNAEIESAVLALDAVQRALAGKPPKKVIVVPQRIVNVVA